jgi:hypothetical protein
MHECAPPPLPPGGDWQMAAGGRRVKQPEAGDLITEHVQGMTSNHGQPAAPEAQWAPPRPGRLQGCLGMLRHILLSLHKTTQPIRLLARDI